jgi:LytS/YehU family sensor histidine kinase
VVDGGTIRVQAHCHDGWLQVRLENEFDQEVPAARRGGLGLQNVRNRLRALYENQARLDTTVTQNVFVVEVDLPCTLHV